MLPVLVKLVGDDDYSVASAAATRVADLAAAAARAPPGQIAAAHWQALGTAVAGLCKDTRPDRLATLSAVMPRLCRLLPENVLRTNVLRPLTLTAQFGLDETRRAGALAVWNAAFYASRMEDDRCRRRPDVPPMYRISTRSAGSAPEKRLPGRGRHGGHRGDAARRVRRRARRQRDRGPGRRGALVRGGSASSDTDFPARSGARSGRWFGAVSPAAPALMRARLSGYHAAWRMPSAQYPLYLRLCVSAEWPVRMACGSAVPAIAALGTLL